MVSTTVPGSTRARPYLPACSGFPLTISLQFPLCFIQDGKRSEPKK